MQSKDIREMEARCERYHVRELAGQAPDSLSSTLGLNSHWYSLLVLDDENPE